MSAIQILLHKSIDYAGLFPPAGLDLSPSVENYARYQASSDSWALGKFVLPVDRITEFEAVAEPYISSDQDRWNLTALLGPETERQIAAVLDFNRRRASRPAPLLVIDSVELKATTTSAITESTRLIPGHLQAYIEIPTTGDPEELIQALGRAGKRAKVRTGGVISDAFPSPGDLIRFMACCVRAGVPFKATAGLHHPVRGEYRLTYRPDSAKGAMFGFLNLFLASAFLLAGWDEPRAQAVLEERSPDAFQLEGDSVLWRDHRLSLEDLKRCREQVLISFGSCSFTEPLEELRALHLLGTAFQA